jgi:hypothetical protein
MELNSYFNDFLAKIRLPDNQATNCKEGHKLLAKQLAEDPKLSEILVDTFLQGSYRRGTAIRPQKDKHADVDVVLVTNLSKDEFSPDQVYPLFNDFLYKYYPEKYELQGRSIGIHLSLVDLDMVITAAPSESEWGIYKSLSVKSYDTLEEVQDWRLNQYWVEPSNRTQNNTDLLLKAIKSNEWKSSPLYIPDRELTKWIPTHPLAQIQWTRDKNARCNGHYINVVKAIKWWHSLNPSMPKHPKGYLIEHLAGICCPDSIQSIAEGVTSTLENIVSIFESNVNTYQVPFLPDHGVPEHNVFGRITPDEFIKFFNQAVIAAKLARNALDSNDPYSSAIQWTTLFGDDFPRPPDIKSNKGFSERTGPTAISGGRFA